ncbi:MAG: fibronectin type III domain-containing protein [Saprospiraceae bacterium]|nr:fibronectin type III domain-containing protein [Saprospiraceae bacterium]
MNRKLLLLFCVLTISFFNAHAQCEKVTNLGVSDVDDQSALLIWTSSDDGVNYEVQIKSKGRTPKFNTTVTVSQPNYEVTDLVPGSEYRFRVRKICPGGSSSGSTKWFVFETTGMSPDEDCPKASDLQVVNATMTTATLSWAGSIYSTHYEVEVRSQGSTPVYFFAKSLIDTSITIFGLDPLGKYHFRVRSTCINSAVSGSAAWHDFTPGESSEEETCPFVEDLHADSITATSVLMVWSTADANSIYELTIEDDQANVLTYAPATSPQFVQGLTPGTEYSASIVSHCENGIPSQVDITFRTDAEMSDSCEAPSNLEATEQDSVHFFLMWESLVGAESYDLQIGDLDSLSSILVDTTILDTTYIFQPTDSSGSYTFRVRTHCADSGLSDWSDYRFFPTSIDSSVLACESPVDLTVDTVIGNNVFLSWTASGTDTYEIQLDHGGQVQKEIVITDAVDITYAIAGLTPQENYNGRIKAICGRDQEGTLSAVVSFSTGDEMSICLPVSGLSAERIDDHSARLLWNAFDTATYVVEVKVAAPSSGSSLILPAVEPGLLVGGLDPAKDYQFRVQTICSTSDSSFYSNWVAFSTMDTLQDVCLAPTNIQLDSVSSTEAWLSWQGIDTLEYRILLRDRDTLVPYDEYLSDEYFIYLDSLMPETEYEVYVQTLCGMEESPLSDVFYFTTLMDGDTLPDSLCMSPVDFRLDSVSTDEAWVSWTGLDSQLFEITVIGPDFEYSEIVSESMIWLKNLPEDSEFELSARSICGENDTSELSEIFVFQTLAPLVEPEDSCRVPVAEIISMTDLTALGSWTSSSSGAFYLIEVENIGLTPNYRLITTSRDTAYLFEDLVPGGTYQWKVAAFCPDGTYSDCTPWMVFETTGEVNCEAPEGLAVSQLTNQGALLTWNATPSGIDYEVEIQSLDTTPFYGMTNIVITNQLNVDDLVPGGTYQFKVNVQCLDGTISEDSDWFTFSTLTGVDTGLIASNISRSAHLVYPNPARQIMNVHMPEELENSPATIELTDMIGRKVFSMTQDEVLHGSEIQIEVTDLREGIYQLSVRSNEQHFHELVLITR